MLVAEWDCIPFWIETPEGLLTFNGFEFAPSFATLFSARTALLVNAWSATHDYSADLVASYAPWGTGAAGDVVQYLAPGGLAGSNVFAAETLGLTDSVEPDWSTAPTPGDTVTDDGMEWTNCGPLVGFPAILPWAVNTVYSDATAAVTPTVPNGHVYITYPGYPVDTTGATEPSWPTDGDFVADGAGYWLDAGVAGLAEGAGYNFLLKHEACSAGFTLRDGADNMPQADGYIIHEPFKPGYQFKFALELWANGIPAMYSNRRLMWEELTGKLDSIRNADGTVWWAPSDGTLRSLANSRLIGWPQAKDAGTTTGVEFLIASSNSDPVIVV